MVQATVPSMGTRADSMQTFTDLYKYRFILGNLVSKELKAQYRNMSLGFLWALLNPLVLIVVLSVAWTVFLEAPPSFPSMVIVALIPYNFFTYCLAGCSMSIVGNVSLVKKVRFPRQILPISVICTHLIHFAIQSTLVVLALIVFTPPHDIVSVHLLWLPVLVVIEIGLVTGIGLLVAGLNVVYRDVQYIVESILTILFWVSPVLWSAGPTSPLERFPDWVYYAYFLNPLSGLLEGFRSVLYFGTSPDLITLGMSVAMTFILGYWGVKSFWKQEREFADLL